MVFSDLKSRLKAVFSLTVRPIPSSSCTDEPRKTRPTTGGGSKVLKTSRALKLKLPWIKRKVPIEDSRQEHSAPSERQSASIIAAALEDTVQELTESVRRAQDAVGAIHHRQQKLQAGFYYLDSTDPATDTLSDSSFLTPEYPYRLHYGPHVENIENSCDLEFDKEVAQILTRHTHCQAPFVSGQEVCFEGTYRCKTRRERFKNDDWDFQLTSSTSRSSSLSTPRSSSLSTPRSLSSSLMSPLALPSAIPAETGPLNETHHISYIPAHCKAVGSPHTSGEPHTSETIDSPTAPHSLRSSLSMSMSFSIKSPVLPAQRLSTKVTPSTVEPNGRQKEHALLSRIESMSGRRKMQMIIDRIRKLEMIRTELRQGEEPTKRGSEKLQWQSDLHQYHQYFKGGEKRSMGRQLWPRGLDPVEAEGDMAITRPPSRRHDIRSPYIYRHTPRASTFQDWLEAHRVESSLCEFSGGDTE